MTFLTRSSSLMHFTHAVIYGTLISFSFAGGIASAALIIQSGSAANVKGEALRC